MLGRSMSLMHRSVAASMVLSSATSSVRYGSMSILNRSMPRFFYPTGDPGRTPGPFTPYKPGSAVGKGPYVVKVNEKMIGLEFLENLLPNYFSRHCSMVIPAFITMCALYYSVFWGGIFTINFFHGMMAPQYWDENAHLKNEPEEVREHYKAIRPNGPGYDHTGTEMPVRWFPRIMSYYTLNSGHFSDGY